MRGWMQLTQAWAFTQQKLFAFILSLFLISVQPDVLFMESSSLPFKFWWKYVNSIWTCGQHNEALSIFFLSKRLCSSAYCISWPTPFRNNCVIPSQCKCVPITTLYPFFLILPNQVEFCSELCTLLGLIYFSHISWHERMLQTGFIYSIIHWRLSNSFMGFDANNDLCFLRYYLFNSED